MSRNGIIALVVGLVVVIAVALATWMWLAGDQDDNGDAEIANGEEQEEQRYPDDWVEYSSAEFGFSFAYPQEWGEVETEQDEGMSGSAFSLSFSDHENVTLTGESLDYESIMGPSTILGAKGWGSDGDSYYFVMSGQQTPAEGASVLETWEGEGLYHIDTSPEAVFDADEVHRASFNLDSAEYDGVVFIYRITDGQTIADYDDFRQVVETVEVF